MKGKTQNGQGISRVSEIVRRRSPAEVRKPFTEKNVEITQSDFIDFTMKTGLPRQTKVREIKERPEYDPKTDFWRQLRTGLIEYHRDGCPDPDQLDDIMRGISNPRKLSAYPPRIDGHKKFVRKKSIEWLRPPRTTWSGSGLTVIVNPEIGMTIDGVTYVTKLYFKEDSPTRSQVDLSLGMMDISLKGHVPEGTVMSILDVEAAKLYVPGSRTASVGPVLAGEAAAFVTIWNSL
jgi:hypothetical protein